MNGLYMLLLSIMNSSKPWATGRRLACGVVQGYEHSEHGWFEVHVADYIR